MEPRRLAVLVLAACVLALPFFLWDFRTYQLAFAATNAIAILGLNLIAGQAGLISLGHGAFYGLGAYTLAVLMRHWGVSAYAGIPAAALVGLVTGYLFGRVVTRLAGFYLALTTFALALAWSRMARIARPIRPATRLWVIHSRRARMPSVTKYHH